MLHWCFDLSKTTGFCLVQGGDRRVHGVMDLTRGTDKHPGRVYRKFRIELDMLHAEHGRPTYVHYEHVHAHHGHKGVPDWHAAHVYGALLGMLQYWTTTLGGQPIPMTGWPIQHIKIKATGKGNAKKAEMVAALSRIGLGWVTDDNEADAIWLAELARNTPREQWPVRRASGKRIKSPMEKQAERDRNVRKRKPKPKGAAPSHRAPRGGN